MSSAWWESATSQMAPWAIAAGVVLAVVAVAALIRWVLTHTVKERMTTILMPYYKADRGQDGHMPSERDREKLTGRCIRVWRTRHGYITHMTRRLVKGLDDKVLLDAAAAACPDGWRHRVRHVLGARWIVSDGRLD